MYHIKYNVIKATVVLIILVLFCDFLIFPILFQNVVHSRYFSLQCKNENDKSCKEINTLIQTRNKYCEIKATNYWKNQARKPIIESVLYDDEFKRYWSPNMVEFLQYNNQETLDLLVMIISVRRRNGTYLKHNARLLHQQIEKMNTENESAQKRKVDLVVCNSDAELNEHKEAIYLSDYIDLIAINRTKRSHKCCPAANW